MTGNRARLLLGLVASALFVACANPPKQGEVGVEGRAGPLEVSATAKWSTETDSGTYELDPVAALSGYPFRIEFSGADGSTSGILTGELDPTGHFRLQIPAGSVRVEGAIVPPPKPESSLGGRRSAIARTTRYAICWAHPIIWSEGPELCYRVTIDGADTFELVDAVLEPIKAAGIGSVVPDSVHIDTWQIYDLEPSGLALTSASPDTWLRHDMNVNDGAWIADLSNFDRAFIGAWDVLEVLIPYSALNLGETRGETYTDRVSYSLRTDAHPGISRFDLSVGRTY